MPITLKAAVLKAIAFKPQADIAVAKVIRTLAKY